MLLYAVIFINLALVFYTIGVWSEKIQNRLKPWHVIVFWIGFACDIIGTFTMETIAKRSIGGVAQSIIQYLPLQMNFHGLSGALALILMAFHALWATIVLIKKDTAMIENFHKFSLVVWIIWLIPFVSGAVAH